MQGRPNLRRWPSQHLSSYEEVHVFIAHYDNNLQTPYLSVGFIPEETVWKKG